MDEQVRTEELRIDGKGLWDRLRILLRESTVRRIIIKNDQGRILFEIPVTVGLVILWKLPVAAALGLSAVLMGKGLTLIIERVGPATTTEAVA